MLSMDVTLQGQNPAHKRAVSGKESPAQMRGPHVTTQYREQARSPGEVDLNTGSRPSLGCCIIVSNSDITAAGFKTFYAQ